MLKCHQTIHFHIDQGVYRHCPFCHAYFPSFPPSPFLSEEPLTTLHILSRKVCKVQPLHILPNIWDCLLVLAILKGYIVRSFCNLIFTSPITNDVEHPFMCLLAICLSTLRNGLLKSFVQHLLVCLQSRWGCLLGIQVFWQINVVWLYSPESITYLLFS